MVIGPDISRDSESFTIILLGAISGISLGMFASYMFMSVIGINSNIPPWEMVYSPLKLIGTVLGMFLMSVISASIPGIIFSRKKEAEIIKEV